MNSSHARVDKKIQEMLVDFGYCHSFDIRSAGYSQPSVGLLVWKVVVLLLMVLTRSLQDVVWPLVAAAFVIVIVIAI